MTKLDKISAGEEVRRRGPFDTIGTVIHFDERTKWTHVKWEGGKGPLICHLYELERPKAKDSV